MDPSDESDRSSLPQLQCNRGNVLIKLGHEKHDWLVVHDKVLSKASPYFTACFRKAWRKTIGINKIKHPKTGRRVRVRTLALKYVEKAFFLEGKEVVEDLHFEAQVFQDTWRSKSWPGSLVGRSCRISEMTKRAFRILFATIHGFQLTAEQVAGCEIAYDGRLEDYGNSPWINETLFPQVVTVCAIAEYLHCLDTVGPAMMAILQYTPRYWQAVAYQPVRHMKFAVKLRNREVFWDAYKHAIAQAYIGSGDVDWQDISDITGAPPISIQYYYSQQLRKRDITAQNLKDDLHRLQISRVAQRTNDEKRYAWIARSIYFQWLAQHLYVQDSPLVPWRLRLEDSDNRTVADGWDAPAL